MMHGNALRLQLGKILVCGSVWLYCMCMPRPHTYYGSLDAEALASLGSMEGLDVPIVVTRSAPEKRKPARPPIWPGYVAALLITAAAYLVHYLPFAPFRVLGEFGVRRPVSQAIIAILLGALARNAAPTQVGVSFLRLSAEAAQPVDRNNGTIPEDLKRSSN